MKNLMLLISVIGLLLVSCSEGVFDDTDTPLTTERKEQMAKEMFEKRVAEIQSSPKEVTIEYATLDEINAIMIEHNLEPFTQADIEQAKVLKTIYPCSTWVSFGDINGDGKVSGIDVAAVGTWLCNHLGCNRDHDLFTYPVPPPYDDFAFMTGLANNADWFILNQDDRLAATSFILGLITCT